MTTAELNTISLEIENKMPDISDSGKLIMTQKPRRSMVN